MVMGCLTRPPRAVCCSPPGRITRPPYHGLQALDIEPVVGGAFAVLGPWCVDGQEAFPQEGPQGALHGGAVYRAVVRHPASGREDVISVVVGEVGQPHGDQLAGRAAEVYLPN